MDLCRLQGTLSDTWDFWSQNVGKFIWELWLLHIVMQIHMFPQQAPEIYHNITTLKATKSNFVISISLKFNGVNLWSFKFTIFDLAEYHLSAFTTLYNFTFKLFPKNIIPLKIGSLKSLLYKIDRLKGFFLLIKITCVLPESWDQI